MLPQRIIEIAKRYESMISLYNGQTLIGESQPPIIAILNVAHLEE